MSAPPPERPRLDVIGGGLALIAAWLLFLPFASMDVDPFHDGLMLKPALDVAAGQTLFRDTLQRYGPLTTYFHTAELMLLGRSLRSIRIGTFLFYGVIALGLVLSWRLVLPRLLTLLAFVLWYFLAPLDLASLPWSSVYALAFQALALLSLLCAVTAAPGRGNYWALAGGVFCGMALMSRQVPLGAVTCASVVAAYAAVALLWPDRRQASLRHALLTMAAGVAVVAIVLLDLLRRGALPAWWDQTVVWMWDESLHTGGLMITSLNFWWKEGLVFCGVALVLLWLVRSGRPIWCAAAVLGAALWAVFSPQATAPIHAFIGITPVAALLAFAAAVRRAWLGRGRPIAEVIIFLAAMIVCLPSWSEAIPTGHPGHLFWALSASYGFSIYAAWLFANRRTALVAVVLALLSMPFMTAKGQAYWKRLTQPRATLTQPWVLAGMRELPHNVFHWQALSRAIWKYSRTRRYFTMILEGNNMVALTLATDLTNGDPSFLRYLNLPYNAERRARYVRDQRPVVLVQPGFTSEPVSRAMREVGYTRLFKWPGHYELWSPPPLPLLPELPGPIIPFPPPEIPPPPLRR